MDIKYKKLEDLTSMKGTFWEYLVWRLVTPGSGPDNGTSSYQHSPEYQVFAWRRMTRFGNILPDVSTLHQRCNVASAEVHYNV